jgi:hypothetical protein
MLKKLNPLGEEYYHFYFMQPSKPMTLRIYKLVTWYFVIFAVLLQLALRASLSSVHGPQVGYVDVANTLMLIVTIAYLIPVLIVTPNKVLLRHYRLSIVLLWLGVILFQATIIYTVTAILVLANENPEVYIWFSLATIALAVCLNIWMLYYGCKRIAAGAYKEDGSGFFNIKNRSKREKIRRIANMVGAAVMPWPLALVAWNSVYNNRIFRQHREPLSPFTLEVVLPIILLFIAVVLVTSCAAVTYRYFVMLYMNHRFGHQHAMVKASIKRRS